MGEIKQGALLAAKAAGVSLIALTAVADRAWVFRRSWDHYTLPKPFARVEIYRSHPIDSSADIETLRTAVQAALTPQQF
jgi:lysophospholipid acyltransferase (LPLAT)-like uncharacterized protein